MTVADTALREWGRNLRGEPYLCLWCGKKVRGSARAHHCSYWYPQKKRKRAAR